MYFRLRLTPTPRRKHTYFWWSWLFVPLDPLRGFVCWLLPCVRMKKPRGFCWKLQGAWLTLKCVNLYFYSLTYNFFLLYIRIKVEAVFKTTRSPLSFNVQKERWALFLCEHWYLKEIVTFVMRHPEDHHVTM